MNKSSYHLADADSGWHQVTYEISLLRITCTVTLAIFPTDEWQAYDPESMTRACWTNRNDAVVSPFSVIWLIPPLGELYDMGWNLNQWSIGLKMLPIFTLSQCWAKKMITHQCYLCHNNTYVFLILDLKLLTLLHSF